VTGVQTCALPILEDDKKGKNKDAAAKNRRIVIKINDVGPDYSTLIK
jgi:hypothetical protein